MAAAITIEPERAGDAPLIAAIVERAFAAVPYSDHREHLLVDRLRETDAYVPALSLLARIGEEAVGHILLTKAGIRNGAETVTTLALAPLSVVPDFQRRGVGTALIHAAHERAGALGFASIVLVGIADYYPRFGYRRLSRYPIRLPFEVADEIAMILPLRPGALDGVAGRVHYPDAWLDH